MNLPTRQQSEEYLKKYVKEAALINHCHMVALALEACAKSLGEDQELWYQTGLLHDIDFEMWPAEHPMRGVSDLLKDYPQELINAVEAHGWMITGREPESSLERYICACDELSGLMKATSLMRPNGFKDMKPKSVTKKIKDKSFAAKINRDDIQKGFILINKEPAEHIQFLIEVFREM